MPTPFETIRAVGRLDVASSLGFEREVIAAVDAGARKLILDFSRLDYISSAGLRVVLIAAKRLSAVGGHMAICSTNWRVERLFEISGFKDFLDICPSMAEAQRTLREKS
jgi:anti-anti-sigma factor